MVSTFKGMEGPRHTHQVGHVSCEMMKEQSGDKGKATSHMPWCKASYDEGGHTSGV